MKNLVGFLSILLSASSTLAQDGWKQIYPNPVAHFFPKTADSAILVDSSAVMLTTDGGKSWQQAGSLPSLVDTDLSGGTLTFERQYNRVFIASLDNILFSTAKRANPPSSQGDINGVIYQSLDLGKTWRSQNSTASGGMGNVPLTTFLRVCDTTVVGFGGRMWSSMEMNVELRSSYCIVQGSRIQIGSFGMFGDTLYDAANPRTAECAVFIEADGKLYRSELSPVEWRLVDSIPPQRTQLGEKTHIVGSSRTTNDGSTWDHVDLPVGPLFGSKTGVAWVSGAELYKSVDAGASWRRIDFAPSFKMIHSIDTSVAYGHGSDGLLYRTSSGGWQLDVKVEQAPRTVRIYPNPSNDQVSSGLQLYWFDLLGRSYDVPSELVGDTYRYNVRELNPGIYIVRFEGGSQMVVVH